jgi:glucokinase
LAQSNDPAAIAVFHQVEKSLGIALAGLIHILSLPLYSIGGGVANARDLFAPSMFAEIERRSNVYRLTRPDKDHGSTSNGNRTGIAPAQCGPRAGLLGAAMLPFRENSVAAPWSEQGTVST